MSDFWFPQNIKPLTNKNYSFGRGGNIVSSPVAGGVPRFGVDTTFDTPVFQLNFILCQQDFNMLLYFYDQRINHGASSFKMNLDSGNGVEEHQCTIIPKSWKASRPNNQNWYLALQVVAEVTSTQIADDYTACVYDLYECYGKDTSYMINGFESILENLPDVV